MITYLLQQILTSCNILKINKILHAITLKVTQHQLPALALVMTNKPSANLIKQESPDYTTS